MSVDSIFPKMREIVADVLMIDEDEVMPNSRLIADLGAESIDFLDLVFQLEKEFDIKIPRGQLEKEARGELTDEEFEQKGVVSAKGIEQLKRYFSEVPAESFNDGLKASDIPSLFTVETFSKLVMREKDKLQQPVKEEVVA